jgi:hypothetical protein
MRRLFVRSLQAVIVIAAILMSTGTLIYLYVQTDPNPWWWEQNYPWYRIVIYGLLIGGALTLIIGIINIILETKIRDESPLGDVDLPPGSGRRMMEFMAYETPTVIIVVVFLFIAFSIGILYITNNQISVLRAEVEALKIAIS